MNPGEDLISVLERLRTRLNSSGTERTSGLLQTMGNDCSFYRKSLDIFIDRDYDDIETLLREAISEFNKVNGNE